ncbi:hypothetical protein [Pontiella sp.]|uniref:hypothetical protein n=1 Tax=Pontiella sp. TaxID=2837462 RepID=UPI0035647D6B
MAALVNILFWLGIVGLVDGSLGLLFLEKWQKMAGTWDIRKVALIEVGAAWAVLILHYLLKFGFGY